MKGVIFNIVEDIVCDRFGADTWDDLLADAGLDGAYTGLGNYDDAHLIALVEAASQRLQVPVPDVLRLVGREAFPRLAARYPNYDELPSSRALLHQLNNVIHPHVLTLYPGAQVPHFTTEDRPDGALVLRYTSARDLCHLAEGLAQGAADSFEEHATVDQEECRHLGGSECRIVVIYGDPDD